MLQHLCGEIYIPIPLMHRGRGFTVELLCVAYSTRHSSQTHVEAVLRRILRDRIFVFEDSGSVYGPYGELDDQVMEFSEEGWTIQLPVSVVEMIPVVASTPPKCFRCALAAHLAARIANEEDDHTHVEILGVNVVRTPGRDVMGRMGLNRALIEPLHSITISGNTISAMCAFRIGYVEQAAETRVAAPHLIIDIRAHSGDINLPEHKFAKVEYKTRVRSMLFGAYDFSRLLEAFGEPEYEFTIATNGEHSFRLIK